MAQFVLKIELLSHIIGTTPILEMARAYGLRPRLWLLLKLEAKTCGVREVRGNVCQYKVTISFGVRGVGVCFMRVLQGYSRDA